VLRKSGFVLRKTSKTGPYFNYPCEINLERLGTPARGAKPRGVRPRALQPKPQKRPGKPWLEGRGTAGREDGGTENGGVGGCRGVVYTATYWIVVYCMRTRYREIRTSSVQVSYEDDGQPDSTV
jgi:hypothetical protein